MRRCDHPSGRSRRPLLLLTAFLGGGGVLSSLAAVGVTIGTVHRVSGAANRVVLAGIRFTYPMLNASEGVLVILALVGATALTIACRGGWRQHRAHRCFMAELNVVGTVERHPRVKVIADPHPQAFCAGYLRPTVYVSQPALELLTDSELDAVLAHEHHHRRVRDPLRFACGRVLSQALFFVPALRSLCDRYRDLAELSADGAAVVASAGQQAPLAGALLRFVEAGPPGACGISPERVDALLGQPVGWRLPWWLTTASLGSLSSLGLLIWRTSQVASARVSLNLPLVSSRPCIVMSSLVVLGCGAVLGCRARRRQPEPRRPAGDR